MKQKLQLCCVLIAAFFIAPLVINAQLTLNLTNQTERIDFDSTKANVNEGVYNGSGISSVPSAGELDADAWQIVGMSTGVFNFGDSAGPSTDYARGSATRGVGSGGLYSFTSTNDANFMGIQAAGSDMTPGSVTLKINNNTGAQLDSLKISYTFYSYSDQPRSSSWNPSFSLDNITYTALPALNDTTELAINTVALTVGRRKDTTLPITILNGGDFYLRWDTDDFAGAGARDEFGVDNIEITGLNASGALSVSSISLNNPTCNGSMDGDATVNTSGGTAPLTYLWSNGLTTVNNTNIGAGQYSVTVTDALGDMAIDSVTLIEPDSILISTISSDNGCFGGNAGFINSTVTGGTMPYSYVWSNGDITMNSDSLIAGAYSVTVIDVNGCSKTASDTVRQVDQIMIAFTDTAAACGTMNGSIKALISGGTPSYSYSWSNGTTGMGDSTYINGLNAGKYVLTITDAFNCEVKDSTTITAGGGFTVSVTSMNTTTASSADGSIDVTVMGGVTPYSYIWNDGVTTEDRMNLAAGKYVVTVSDSGGCAIADSAVISSPAAIPAIANLVINEINYNGPESGTDTSEFIEIYNADSSTINLNGYFFSQGVTYTFTVNDSITANQYFVIAYDSSSFRNRYGINADAIWTAGGLTNGGEDITIVDNLGRTVDSVDFDDNAPWPSGSGAGQPDGGGASIELAFANLDNNMGNSWQASNRQVLTPSVNGQVIYGSPGNASSVVLGINHFGDSKSAINIYPNPTNGQITITFENINFQERLQIIDMKGKLIRNELVNQPKLTIDLSNYSNGIYFVRVGELTKKVILTR